MTLLDKTTTAIINAFTLVTTIQYWDKCIDPRDLWTANPFWDFHFSIASYFIQRTIKNFNPFLLSSSTYWFWALASHTSQQLPDKMTQHSSSLNILRRVLLWHNPARCALIYFQESAKSESISLHLPLLGTLFSTEAFAWERSLLR